MKSKLVFVDPSLSDGNQFEIFNDGSAAEPTLFITGGW